MHKLPKHQTIILALWAIVGWTVASHAAPKAALLRYHWAEGEKYAYEVEFKADTENEIQTTAGTVVYSVTDVAGDIATISFEKRTGGMQRQPKQGDASIMRFPALPAGFWTGSPSDLPQQIKVDSSGKVLQQIGRNSPLPQALGNVEDLIFTPFPPEKKNSWDTQTDCVIRQNEFRRVAPMSSFGHNEQTIFAAHEKAVYQLGTAHKGTAKILETYELKTEEQVQGEPRMKLTGDGTIRFDTALGLPLAMEFEGVFTETSHNATSRIPVTLRYRLLEGAEKTNALIQAGRYGR